MSKERLLVASAAEVQLQQAVELVTRAVANLNALKFGVKPATDAANKALKECMKAHAHAVELLARFPFTGDT